MLQRTRRANRTSAARLPASPRSMTASGSCSGRGSAGGWALACPPGCSTADGRGSALFAPGLGRSTCLVRALPSPSDLRKFTSTFLPVCAHRAKRCLQAPPAHRTTNRTAVCPCDRAQVLAWILPALVEPRVPAARKVGIALRKERQGSFRVDRRLVSRRPNLVLRCASSRRRTAPPGLCDASRALTGCSGLPVSPATPAGRLGGGVASGSVFAPSRACRAGALSRSGDKSSCISAADGTATAGGAGSRPTTGASRNDAANTSGGSQLSAILAPREAHRMRAPPARSLQSLHNQAINPDSAALHDRTVECLACSVDVISFTEMQHTRKLQKATP